MDVVGIDIVTSCLTAVQMNSRVVVCLDVGIAILGLILRLHADIGGGGVVWLD